MCETHQFSPSFFFCRTTMEARGRNEVRNFPKKNLSFSLRMGERELVGGILYRESQITKKQENTANQSLENYVGKIVSANFARMKTKVTPNVKLFAFVIVLIYFKAIVLASLLTDEISLYILWQLYPSITHFQNETL